MKLLRLFLFFILIIFIISFVSTDESVSFDYNLEESGTFSFLESIFTTFGSVFGEDESEYGAQGANLFLDKESGENFLNVFGEDSVVKIGDNTYENMGSDSFFEFDNEGGLKSFKLFASEDDTSWNFQEFGLFEGLSKGDGLELVDGEIIFTKSENSDGLFNWNGDSFELLGDSFNMNLMDDGNYLFNGNLKTDLYDLSGLGENGVAEFLIDKDNKLIEVWGGTKAKLYGVDLDVYSDVKIYYKDDFNAEDYKGNNYFNFGDNKINAGGSGWSFRLDEDNKIYGDMITEKEFHGQNPKKRFLDVSLYGGDVEIEKTFTDKKYHKLVLDKYGEKYINVIKEEPDVSFNFKGEGIFKVDNGRVSFGSEIRDNKLYDKDSMESSLTGNLFVNSHLSEDSFSYDMKIDYDGKEYYLQDNIFMDLNGNELIDANYKWERIRLNAMEILDSPLKNQIIDEIKDERGYKPSDYVSYAANVNYEPLLKWSCEAADYVNKNNQDGFEISCEEVWMVLFQEGMAYNLILDEYEKDPYFTIYNTQIGMDTTTIPNVWKQRVESGYIPDDLQLYNVQGGYGNEDIANTGKLYYAEFKEPRDAIITLAGDFSYRMNKAQLEFIEYHGQDAYNQLNELEKFQMGYAYFNGGSGNYQKRLPNYENSLLGKSSVEGGIHSVLGNANRVAGTFELLEKLGIFNVF